jgi:hypothetical protein
LPPEIDRWYLDTPHTPPSDPTPTQVIACENPYGVHLEHLRDGRWRYIWKDCQRPSCRGCAPRWKALRQKMLVREAMEFERHNPSQPWFVFTAEDGTNWQTISAYISRRRGQFARCNRNGEGYLSCVATVHPGPSAKDVREMRPMDAAKLLGGHIQGMPLIDKKHAFTTSRGWVIEEKIKKWQSQWRRISKISTSIHRVISILRHREADLKNVFSPENQTWTWHGVELHPITLNADPEHVANEVSCGEVLPEFEADLPWGDGLEYSTGPPGSAGASLLAW